VHEKSQDKDAIPLLLLHGWPGLRLGNKRFDHFLTLF
jgi:hypothetical protein